MRLRFLLSLILVLTSALSLQAEPVKPTAVIVAKPVSRLLGEYQEMIRQVAGPVESERAVKEFEHHLKEELGDQGFDGLDINRPLAAYIAVHEKVEDSNPILIVPVTGEQDFIAFLQRLKIKATAIQGKKGLYHLRIGGLDFLPNESHVQFVEGGWAYVGLNGDDVADANCRLPLDGLFDNADLSLIAANFYPGRLPQPVLKNWLDELDQAANGIKGFLGAVGPKHVTKIYQTFFEEGPKLVRRYGETGIKEATTIRLQFSWDPATAEALTELVLTPKPGTLLAKEVATRAATTHRFAAMIPPNAVVGVAVKLPLFAREVQEIVASVLEALEVEIKPSEIPSAFHPVLEELAKGAIQSVKKGDLDFAFALVGPEKEGKFSIVAAMNSANSVALEKALRQAAQVAEYAKHFELDLAKVAGVSIHKVPFTRLYTEEVLRELAPVFGENPPSYVAITKDAAYLSFGLDSLAVLKAALEAKAAPLPVAVEITGNTQRIQKLVSTLAGDVIGNRFAQEIGSEDKLASMFRVTVEGGERLKVSARVNLRYLPRFIVVGEQLENAPAQRK